MTSKHFYTTPSNTIEVKGKLTNEWKNILSKEALLFLEKLHFKFETTRQELLENRKKVQKNIDLNILPDFLKETQFVRSGSWKAAPVPEEIQDRRVEITGPVDRKMVINGLNSGARVFMADFEDATSPTWSNIMSGQINLRDAILNTIEYHHPTKNKVYTLNDTRAVLFVRPRGWHLNEQNICINGKEMSASLFDFGLFFFTNAKALIEKGSAPYFYLPKLEHYLEARLWNDVFAFAQEQLNIPQKTIKATVLIETITASFQMDEILYELKDHSAGLNCGRWDYIFSFIKRFRNLSHYIFPNRDQVTMLAPFMEAYTQLVVDTCHKRGVHAIGGMAAQIPVRDNAEKNRKAFEKVKIDKEREVKNGHDGTWVAHPGLIPVAKEVFDKHMPSANQIDKEGSGKKIDQSALLHIPKGTITEQGIRTNINVGILYVESWLSGTGAAALYNLMEDAATAEISRSQIWQWYHHGAIMDDGRQVNPGLFDQLVREELDIIKEMLGHVRYEKGRFQEASTLFAALIKENQFEEFLTLKAYQILEK